MKWEKGTFLILGLCICGGIGLTGLLVYLLSLLFPFDFSWRIAVITYMIIVLIKLLFHNGGSGGGSGANSWQRRGRYRSTDWNFAEWDAWIKRPTHVTVIGNIYESQTGGEHEGSTP